VPLSGTAVPLRPNAQLFAAVPLVVQFSVPPSSVPLPLPVTATPLHVALYAIVAVVAPVGVTVQFIAEQVPIVVVVVFDRHDPENALIAGVGVVGVSDVDRPQAAAIIDIVRTAEKSMRLINGSPISHDTTRTFAGQLGYHLDGMARPSAPQALGIRADANARIGAGHAMRCIALAEAWRRAGGDTALFTVAPPPLVCAAAERRRIEVRPFGSDAAAWDALAAWARERSDPWVVLDSYELGRDAQRAARACGARVLVIDDGAAGREFECDVLVNPNVGADALDYEIGAATRCCFGPSYALLRSEFTHAAPARRFDAPASRIVVTFGGADVHNQAARVARMLAASTPPLDVTVVAGQAHAPPPDIAPAAGVHLRWQSPTDDMAALFGRADLAICAAGSTCWELAHLGIPALTLVVADNQKGVASGLHAAGVIVNLGSFDGVSDAKLASAFETLRRGDARAEMSRRGRELVDGRGADRVVEAMRLAAVEA
jgi:UDP-2,4-diacetamido-2,4,6-trideoxy-beta-L-altropyranose hydrolase